MPACCNDSVPLNQTEVPLSTWFEGGNLSDAAIEKQACQVMVGAYGNPVIITVAILLGLVSISGIILNYTVIFSVLYTKTLRESHHYKILLNLSLVDALFSTFVIPFKVFDTLNVGCLLPRAFCRGITIFANTLVLMALGTLTVLSLHKYIHVYFPFRYHLFTDKKFFVIHGFLWLFMLLKSTLSEIIGRAHVIYTPVTRCLLINPFMDNVAAMRMVSFALMVIQFTVIAFANVRLARTVHIQLRRINALEVGPNTNQSVPPTLTKKESRAIITALSLVLAYFILWIPPFIIVIIHYIYFEIPGFEMLMLLSFLDVVANPVIYSRDRQLRRVYMNMILKFGGGDITTDS
ncbi:cannabinoid receptor type 1B-like [Ptychodera flava]|uniref:cannabinoid receptor type 1B-like n=1 Tax=Ptychodera flava TaxID=63121 RepID=UPI003969D0B7